MRNSTSLISEIEEVDSDTEAADEPEKLVILFWRFY